MSRLSNNTLRIALSPEHVSCLRLGGWLRPRIAAKDTRSCVEADAGTPPWMPAVETLAQHMEDHSGRLTASFILSNRFCRYASLPANPALKTADEWLAYAMHRMRTVHGDIAQNWALKISPTREGAQLVSAVDRALLERLRAICEEKHLTPTSIQPYFATVFNRCRHVLQKQSGWLVVEEARHCTVALLDRGAWKSLTTRRIPAPSATDLYDMLDRERLLLGLENDAHRDIWLHAWRPQRFQAKTEARYRLHPLPVNPYRLAEDEEAAYAMAA